MKTRILYVLYSTVNIQTNKNYSQSSHFVYNIFDYLFFLNHISKIYEIKFYKYLVLQYTYLDGENQ